MRHRQSCGREPVDRSHLGVEGTRGDISLQHDRTNFGIDLCHNPPCPRRQHMCIRGVVADPRRQDEGVKAHDRDLPLFRLVRRRSAAVELDHFMMIEPVVQ